MPTSLVKRLIHLLLRYESKEFWKVVKTLTGLAKKTPMVSRFNSESIRQNNLPRDYSTKDYFAELYTAPRSQSTSSTNLATPWEI